MNIDDKLVLNDAILNTPSLPPGSILNIEDQFTSRNKFFGIQMGARTNKEYCNFYMEGSAEIAIGINYQRLIIQGQTNVNETVTLQSIGLFAEPTNIGNHKNSQFGILPELKIKAGYNFNSFARPYISYNLLFMNNILRSANQIDRNINQSQNILLGGSGVLTGAPAPVSHLRQSSLWLQGFGIGIDFG
jgi:hypothetical protein